MSLRASIRVCVLGLALILGLASLASAQEVTQTNLVSDQAGVANNQDSLLVNAFGIARGTGTNWMVSDRGLAFSTSYDGFGNSNFVAVTIPPAVTTGTGQPTGVVFNGSTSFNVPGSSVPAQFLFATADGTIQAYNPNVDLNNAFIAVNNNSKGASYTGLTIAEVTPGVFDLFAANFKTGGVDVFDGNFNPVANTGVSAAELAGVESTGISGVRLAPFNIQTLGPDLVITFAGRGTNGQVVAGSNLGLVLIKSASGGNRTLETIHGSFLNAPYGIALAPADYGRLSHRLLIGNAGSGTIATFDPISGKFQGFVFDSTGATLALDGLHGFGFGATGAAGDPNFANQQSGAFNTLVFASGPMAGAHGLVGSLTPVSTDFVLGEQ